MRIWKVDPIDISIHEEVLSPQRASEVLDTRQMPYTVKSAYPFIFLTEEDAVAKCLSEVEKQILQNRSSAQHHEDKISDLERRNSYLVERREMLDLKQKELSRSWRQVEDETPRYEPQVDADGTVSKVEPLSFSIGKLSNCPRCGKTHENLIFNVFSNPQADVKYSHWTLCPFKGEPILSRIAWHINQFNVDAAETA